MTEVANTFHPILIMIAIGLTVAATYAALDMFILIRKSEKNSRLLFLGGTISMGIGIWVVDFIGLMADHFGHLSPFQFSMTILSILIGITFTGMAFFSMIGKSIRFYQLVISSLLLLLAVLSIYMISVHAMNVVIRYNIGLLIFSAALIFSAFLFSFRLLFFSKNGERTSQSLLKPISVMMISGTIVAGHYLLTRAIHLTTYSQLTQVPVSIDPFFIYPVLFVSILILAGLIGSSTLISNKLSESDTKLRDVTLALNQSSIVAITDEKGIITFVNDKFCETSKYSREELVGSNHSILNSGYHSREFFNELWETIISGHVWKGEIRNRAKDGSLYWVDTTIVPFMDKHGRPYQYLAIRNDITERKKTEEILHQQDKLATVGQLAAGVAHEIRNPLTSMKGYAEFLQLDEKDPQRIEFLDIILDEIDRVNMIVEDFMVLAKPNAVQLQERNLVPVIKNVVSLLEFEARKRNVRLHFSCDQEIIKIDCDENRLKQVFLNLIKNGAEAMPNGGDLYVNTIMEARNVHISIQDTGVGIPPENLSKLGEPFFTTKKNGNGLGLMVSFKIIESHHGKVYVESEINKGTTFNLLLPAKTG